LHQANSQEATRLVVKASMPIGDWPRIYYILPCEAASAQGPPGTELKTRGFARTGSLFCRGVPLCIVSRNRCCIHGMCMSGAHARREQFLRDDNLEASQKGKPKYPTIGRIAEQHDGWRFRPIVQVRHMRMFHVGSVCVPVSPGDLSDLSNAWRIPEAQKRTDRFTKKSKQANVSFSSLGFEPHTPCLNGQPILDNISYVC
jgi:hypothetical protein